MPKRISKVIAKVPNNSETEIEEDAEKKEEKTVDKVKKVKKTRAPTLYNKFVSENWEKVEGVAKEKMKALAKLWATEKLKVAKKAKKA
jgi:hypothetical protein